MRRARGFTLLELLVVIVIIIILTSTTIGLMSLFMKGQGVRQGALIVSQAVSLARQLAAEKRKVHYLVFSASKDEGYLEIHEDEGDGAYNPALDPQIAGRKIELSKFVVFETAPGYVAFQPSGYMSLYDSGGGNFAEIQASKFDSDMNANKMVGDVVLGMFTQDKKEVNKFKMCMDLDRGTGKVRRFFFLDTSQ